MMLRKGSWVFQYNAPDGSSFQLLTPWFAIGIFLYEKMWRQMARQSGITFGWGKVGFVEKDYVEYKYIKTFACEPIPTSWTD